MLLAQQRRDLDKSDVDGGVHGAEDIVAIDFDALGAPIAPLTAGLGNAPGAPGVYPAHSAGDRNAEPISRRSTRQARFNSRNDPRPQIR